MPRNAMMPRETLTRGEGTKIGSKAPRGSADLVNFYSFLQEHNLRREASMILKDVVELQKRKNKKRRRKRVEKMQ